MEMLVSKLFTTAKQLPPEGLDPYPESALCEDVNRKTIYIP